MVTESDPPFIMSSVSAEIPSPTEFMEVRYMAHLRQLEAKKVIHNVEMEFNAKFKRKKRKFKLISFRKSKHFKTRRR